MSIRIIVFIYVLSFTGFNMPFLLFLMQRYSIFFHEKLRQSLKIEEIFLNVEDFPYEGVPLGAADGFEGYDLL